MNLFPKFFKANRTTIKEESIMTNTQKALELFKRNHRDV